VESSGKRNIPNFPKMCCRSSSFSPSRFHKVFELACDASGLVLGAMACNIEKFNEPNKKYCTYDQELYAIVKTLYRSSSFEVFANSR